jgi:hypothetical protein
VVVWFLLDVVQALSDLQSAISLNSKQDSLPRSDCDVLSGTMGQRQYYYAVVECWLRWQDVVQSQQSRVDATVVFGSNIDTSITLTFARLRALPLVGR